MPELPELATPLPTLLLDTAIDWQWPQPPFARSQVMSPLRGDEPCRIEKTDGSVADGQLVHFDVQDDAIFWRAAAAAATSAPTRVPFSSLRRLTLTTSWPLARRVPGTPTERVPGAAQERGYRVALVGGGELVGRTMGHVRESQGLFLFASVDNGAALQRVFVPRPAYLSLAFDKSAEELAAERWIAGPEELIAAIAAQLRAPVKPLGDALIDLGLVTREQLDLALREQNAARDVPIGEALVAKGVLSRSDLRTALAHKMGYPLVDLARFPIDPNAVAKVPQRSLVEFHVVPLMQHADTLIVAIDDLARVPQLQGLQSLSGLKVVPVLASRCRIAMALAALPQRLGMDRWSDNVPVRPKALPQATAASR